MNSQPANGNLGFDRQPSGMSPIWNAEYQYATSLSDYPIAIVCREIG